MDRMRKLRKIVASAILGAVLLGNAGAAARAQSTTQVVATGGTAFTDVTAGTPHSNSIQELSVFGLTNGVSNGQYEYDPNGNVTRAEFAKFVLEALGLGNATLLRNNQSSNFSDVSTGQWYTGYVNMAAAKDVINGFPDGTFRPNGEVTYAQAISMLVRALGYDSFITGSWPVGDIAEAEKIQDQQGVPYLFSGLGISDVNAPVNRADAAKMVMNGFIACQALYPLRPLQAVTTAFQRTNP